MDRSARGALALAFFAVIGAVLARPIVAASGGAETVTPAPSPAATKSSPRPRPSPPAPTPRPSPAPAPTVESVPEAPDELAAEVPEQCFAPTAPGRSLVAAYRSGEITLGPPSGGTVTALAADAPIGFSGDGRYLAAGGGELYSAAGESLGELFGTGAERWAWSPRGACAVALVDGELVLGAPDEEPITLVEDGVAGFAFSPDGTRLAFLMGEERQALAAADLAGGDVTSAGEAERGSILGWIGDWVLLGEDARRGDLRAVLVGPAGDRQAAGTMPYPQSPEPCPPDALAVSGAGATPGGPGHRLLRFRTGGGDSNVSRVRLTPSHESHSAPSCSPSGDFIVSVRAPGGSGVDDRRLVLLERDGTFVTRLTTDDAFADEYPDWGPDGTGVLFVRRPLGGGVAQIWWLPEGEAARATGREVDTPHSVRGHFEWRRILDWSATPPAGTPPA